MTTKDPGRYSEIIGNLEQEDHRAAALNDIKTLLNYMPNEDAASILKSIGMARIFQCLQVNDKVQFDTACELLELCFEKFNPGEVIKINTGHIMFILRHEKQRLRKLAVEEVYKAVSTSMNLLPVPEYIDVFVAVSQLVADSDVGIANKAILVTSHLPKEAYPKVLDEMKITLEMNSSSRCNALEVIVNIASNSPELLELSAQLGYISFLMSEINSTDVLYQVNILELLSRLAVTKHGIKYLVEHGALNQLSESIGELKNNPVGSLLMPGYMKFFGCCAHMYPREILQKYPVLIECIYGVFESKDQTVLPIAMDTLGFIGCTFEGKLSMAAYGSKYIQILDDVCELIRSGSSHIRLRAVNCLANLISVEKDPQAINPVDPRVTLMTREWFRGLSKSPGPLEYLLTMCKNPFIDIQFAAFNLLDAVCQHKWGQEMINETAGFIEYLLDRKVDHTKKSKELKFEIIKRLSRSSVFDAKTSLNLKKFVEDGPYYVEPALEVAMQEGD